LLGALYSALYASDQLGWLAAVAVSWSAQLSRNNENQLLLKTILERKPNRSRNWKRQRDGAAATFPGHSRRWPIRHREDGESAPQHSAGCRGDGLHVQFGLYASSALNRERALHGFEDFNNRMVEAAGLTKERQPPPG